MKAIAIECDTEDQLSYIPQVQGMVQKLGFTSEILSSEQIIAGELFRFDAVIFPGGMGAFYGLREYEGFADAIRYFVTNGGGYMGICGGAYVAGLRMTETLYSYCPRTLGLIGANISSPPWIRYSLEYLEATRVRVPVTCQIIAEPHPIVIPYQGQVIDIVYSGGPLIEIGPEVIPLLTYVNDIMPPGAVALCCSIFGKGKVVISSPHPEAPWGEDLVNTGCQEWLYLNMLRWVSEPEEKVRFPFFPWIIERRFIPYPLIPIALALTFGVVATFGITKIIKGVME